LVKGRKKSMIDGFENYEINEKGEVFLLSHYYPDHKCYGVLSNRIDRGGYRTVRLSGDKKTHTQFIHRLLACAFISNPENKPFVNHKDGNKLNNTLSNLEWVTHQENVQEAYKQGLNSTAKRIIDTSTGRTYPSIADAALAIGLNYNTCCKRLKRNDPTFSLKYLGQVSGQSG
jgi:hypothetical protein